MISTSCDHDQHDRCHTAGCLCGCHMLASVGLADYWNAHPGKP